MTYAYDAFNRLVKRTIQASTSDPVTTGFFVHDGNQIVLELEEDGDVAHRLLWGPVVDMALADETGGGTTYWGFGDHLGTVRDVATYNAGTNVTTVANHIAFDSFGRRLSETNSALGDFDLGFTGKWLDRDTGLQWNQNRWYNPSIQRWMSEDPIGFNGGDANLSRYAANSPSSFTDPDGLENWFTGGIYGAYVGARRVGQTLLAPIRWTGIPEMLGAEEHLRNKDAELECDLGWVYSEEFQSYRTAADVGSGMYALGAYGVIAGPAVYRIGRDTWRAAAGAAGSSATVAGGGGLVISKLSERGPMLSDFFNKGARLANCPQNIAALQWYRDRAVRNIETLSQMTPPRVDRILNQQDRIRMIDELLQQWSVK